MSRKTETPSQDEIAALPRWARVAFAARCARRIQPLFAPLWLDAPKKYLNAVDRAITIAEQCGASPAADAAANAAAYAYAGAAAPEAAGAYAAANAAAAKAAAKAADAYAYAAAYAAGANARAATRSAMRRDFELLEAASKEEAWDDTTPVPPAFFGPLWPEGEPEGWPAKEERNENASLIVEIDVPDDASDEEVIAAVRELAERADGVHRAYGGRGLEVNEVEIDGEAGVREGVRV